MSEREDDLSVIDLREIALYIHCRKCLEEKPEDLSPQEYNRTESGITYDGYLRVDCVRHDLIVAAFPLDLSRGEDEE